MNLRDVNIGERIKSVLHQRKIVQSQLGEMICVPQSKISKILSRSSIDTDELYKISEALNYNFFEEYCIREENKKENVIVTSYSSEFLQRFEQLHEQNIRMKDEIKEKDQTIYFLEDRLSKYENIKKDAR